jgi:hypothetical protein
MTQTWLGSLAGGLLIGLAAVLLLWLNGRIAGISGILFPVTRAPRGDRAWRIAFLLGLIGAGGVLHNLTTAGLERRSLTSAALLAAGFLVGFGAQLGGGCTSGHGVCGLARLSTRSIVATLTFLASGMLTVLAMRQLRVLS